jgi:hypothetical protein
MGYQPVNVGNPATNRAINTMLAALDDSPPMWWYLSFVDPDLAPPLDQQVPGGPSWLGACWVKAPNEIMACTRAHELGCNPGGQVGIWGPYANEDIEHVPEEDRNRLLTHTDVGLPEPGSPQC